MEERTEGIPELGNIEPQNISGQDSGLQPIEPQEKKKSGAWFYVFLAVVVLFLGFRIWFSSQFVRVEVSGSSMSQTLNDKDVLFMNIVKNGEGLQRGDVIVVNVSGYGIKDIHGNEVSYLIKRLIAVEGDKVKCKDGQISIMYSGTNEYVLLNESYAYYGGMPGQDATDYDFSEYVVGEGEIFFLGDNRLNSVDSRYKESSGSHLIGRLYETTDVYGVVPTWAMEYKDILCNLFFL